MVCIHILHFSFFILPLSAEEPGAYRTVRVAAWPEGDDESGNGSLTRPYATAEAAVKELKRMYAMAAWMVERPDEPGRIVALGQVTQEVLTVLDEGCPPIVLEGGCPLAKLAPGSGVRGSLLRVSGGVRVTLRGITVEGTAGNDAPLIVVDGGSLVLDAGACVTGNTNSVAEGNGYGGGILVVNGGTLTVKAGAVISGNRVSAAGKAYGGGVCAMEGTTFVMTGGTIGGNEAAGGAPYSSWGGGVYSRRSIVLKRGGIIYGRDAPSVELQNTADTGDAMAPSLPLPEYEKRDGTVGEDEDVVWGQGTN
jgi:hypothetical protein